VKVAESLTFVFPGPAWIHWTTLLYAEGSIGSGAEN
jgi:hypothetical protein